MAKSKTIKVRFPKDLNSVMLSTVMKIDAILKHEKLSDLSKMFQTLALFTGTQVDQLAKAEMKDINKLYSRMGEMLMIGPESKFQRFITVQGREFGFIPDIDGIEGGEFMDMDNLSNDGFKNFHKVLAILYRPVLTKAGDFYELIDYMKESQQSKEERERLFLKYMTYEQARGGLYFFLNFSRMSMN